MASTPHLSVGGEAGGEIGGAADLAPADLAPGPDYSSDKQRVLQRQLVETEALDITRLRSEWRRLFRAEPPQLSRDLIVRALAYRLQERVHGGLSKSTERQLASLARGTGQSADKTVDTSTPIRPGARLVREWRGRTHTVQVTERGFEYAGTLFTSLTTIAREITGAHWSGPRFFGLRATRKTGDASVSAIASRKPGVVLDDGQHGCP